MAHGEQKTVEAPMLGRGYPDSSFIDSLIHGAPMKGQALHQAVGKQNDKLLEVNIS